MTATPVIMLYSHPTWFTCFFIGSRKIFRVLLCRARNKSIEINGIPGLLPTSEDMLAVDSGTHCKGPSWTQVIQDGEYFLKITHTFLFILRFFHLYFYLPLIPSEPSYIPLMLFLKPMAHLIELIKSRESDGLKQKYTDTWSKLAFCSCKLRKIAIIRSSVSLLETTFFQRWY